MIKMAKIDIQFMTKTAEKTVPFGIAHTYIAYITTPSSLDSKPSVDQQNSISSLDLALKKNYFPSENKLEKNMLLLKAVSFKSSKKKKFTPELKIIYCNITLFCYLNKD